MIPGCCSWFTGQGTSRGPLATRSSLRPTVHVSNDYSHWSLFSFLLCVWNRVWGCLKFVIVKHSFIVIVVWYVVCSRRLKALRRGAAFTPSPTANIFSFWPVLLAYCMKYVIRKMQYDLKLNWNWWWRIFERVSQPLSNGTNVAI